MTDPLDLSIDLGAPDWLLDDLIGGPEADQGLESDRIPSARASRIGTVHFLTGLYFKRRETSVYSRLLNGLRDRGSTFRAFQNHAKILLLNHGDDHYTITGSANLTANPRAEQYDWTNDRAVWTFYRDWFAEMLRDVKPEAAE